MVVADIAVAPIALITGLSVAVVYLPVVLAETIVLWLLGDGRDGNGSAEG